MLSYDLAEIVVNDGSIFEAETNTVNKVSLAAIAGQNGAAVTDIARLIPAAHIQTNSRGESLIYLRNAGERQVALFFNGALLNIPWDNRINLDLIPTSVIGGMTISKGVPSVLYGTNAVGGAINITSRSIEYDGSITELEGRMGSHGNWNGSATHLFTSGGFQFTGALGYQTRDGIALPSDAGLTFNQIDDQVRTNTDRSMLNVFAQSSYRFSSGSELGLSYLFLDGDFGIAPEGHLDPQISNVRFWRYPRWNNSMIILNGSVPLGSVSLVRGALWGTGFEQNIESHSTVNYVDVEELQEDRDRTAGSRLIWSQQLGEGQLSLSWNGLFSEHEELVIEAGDDGSLDEAPEASPDKYSQFVYSAGIEYSFPVSASLRANLGGSLDGFRAIETGDKPSFDPLVDYGISSGLQVRLKDNLLLRAAAGRKVRFPTLRELFGVALNRFLLNPDLKPENAFVTELALVSQGEVLSGEVVSFFHRTFDTIDQQTVEVDGQRLRQRINLDGSRVWGVELVARARPAPGWLFDGHLTWMEPRGFEGDETVRLSEKPAILGSLNVMYSHTSGFSASGSGVLTGQAYAKNEANAFESLDPAFELDLKGAYRFTFGSGKNHAEIYFRVDNLFDVTTLPQLGLPAAGRFFSGGIGFFL